MAAAAAVVPSPGFEIEMNAEYFKLLRQGDEHFYKGEVDEAKEYYIKALACTDPTPCKRLLGNLNVKLATIYGEQQDWTKVLEFSSKAIELEPFNCRAYFGRYQAYDAIGKFEESLDAIANACFLTTTEDVVFLRLLDRAIMKASIVEVEEQYIKNQVPNRCSKYGVNSYFKTFSNDVIAKWWKGKFAQSENEAALVEALKNCGLNDSSAGDSGGIPLQSGFVTALKQLSSQDYSKIVDLCSEELKSENTKYKSESHLLRGTFRLLCGYHAKDVLEDIEAVISSPNAGLDLKISAWIKRGETFSLSNNLEEVRKSFEKAQELDPENPDAYVIYCNALMENDKIVESYAQICKAVEKRPDFPYAVGVQCFMKFRVEFEREGSNCGESVIDALKLFLENMARFPNSADMHVAFGYFFKDLREPCAAYMHFNRAMELDPENMAYAVNRIMMRFEITCDPLKATTELNSILEKDEQNICAYEALGTIYLAMNDLDMCLFIIDKGLLHAKARHDFISLCTLKKTAEIRRKMNEKQREQLTAEEAEFKREMMGLAS